MALFTLRYRKGMVGAVSGLIEASDLAQAEAVGRKFCELREYQGYRFISVEPAVLATEEILKAPAETPAKTRKSAAA